MMCHLILINNRAATYQIKGDEEGRIRDSLTSLIKKAVDVIIKKNPIKAFMSFSQTQEQIKRSRDIEHLKWILGAMYLPAFDFYYENAPRMVDINFVIMWDKFLAIFTSSTFNLYDSKARKYIDEIYNLWRVGMEYEDEYDPNTKTGMLFFRNFKAMPLSEKQKQRWMAIEKAKNELLPKIREFIQYVRNEYVDIDFNEINRAAEFEISSTTSQ